MCVAGNSHYPDGMCTIRCDSDAQCPPHTMCVDDAGGICAVSCSDPGDCADFGRGYTCRSVGRKGTGGDTNVCRAD
jgi:hypothetical protein